MSLKEGLPSRAFSLLYLATHELDVSLKLATALATLGSFLSMPIVLLTLLITSSVSFTYSSSEAASAGAAAAATAISPAERIPAEAIDRNSRRRGCGGLGNAALEAGAAATGAAASLDLMRGRGFGVVVGVMRVGEAMVRGGGEGGGRERVSVVFSEGLEIGGGGFVPRGLITLSFYDFNGSAQTQ